MNLIGIDIGGTKCAVILGSVDQEGQLTIFGKSVVQTQDFPDPYRMIDQLQQETEQLLNRYSLTFETIASIGISCGGPLDSKTGMVLSPPNLPGWDKIPIVKLFKDKYGIPTSIQNDANACALAEWKFGAGRGTRNMIFMTFGTGLGAGLILDGRLYSGTNDNAGEVGHIRLDNFGPVGYGKSGSFEGFCSGSGIAQLAKSRAMEKLQMGIPVGFCKSINEIESITAKIIAEAVDEGDEIALEVYQTSGSYLGKGISILIDILNPERVVIGSIYERASHLLSPSMMEIINKEALSLSKEVCQVVPAELGDLVGDYASLSVAVYGVENNVKI